MPSYLAEMPDLHPRCSRAAGGHDPFDLVRASSLTGNAELEAMIAEILNGGETVRTSRREGNSAVHVRAPRDAEGRAGMHASPALNARVSRE